MNDLWKKKSQEEIKSTVFEALANNINYDQQHILGIPASYLDDKVFQQDASFVKDAPFISTLIQNPNHIGCHTLGKSESFFQGTQAIEKELIEICSVAILKGEPRGQDGYVSSGGTEANMQAIWIYRNYFINKFSAKREDICILCSEDSHYSMDKAADILVLDIFKVPVDANSREISKENLEMTLREAQKNKKRYFIVICNMMTTMFGSVDNVDTYVGSLKDLSCEFKMHVDGAYGGFYYPFTEDHSPLTFENPDISSFTLDAHKMAQAPYGTLPDSKRLYRICKHSAGKLRGRGRLYIDWEQVWCKCNCGVDDFDEKRALWMARKDFYIAKENRMDVQTTFPIEH